MFDDYDPFDVMPICSNCAFEGEKYSCNCEERIQDIKENKEKDCSQYCVYFKPQAWILAEQQKYLEGNK